MYILLQLTNKVYLGWKPSRGTKFWDYILQDTQAALRSLIKKNGVYRVYLSLSPKRGYQRVSVGRRSDHDIKSSKIAFGNEKSILCHELMKTVFGKVPRRFYFKITKDTKPKKAKS